MMLIGTMENHEDILLSSSTPTMASSPLQTECHSATSATNTSAFYIPKTHSSSPVRIPHSFHVKSFTNSDKSDASNSDDESSQQQQRPNSSPQIPSEKGVIIRASNNSMALDSTPAGVVNVSSLSTLGYSFLNSLPQPNLLLPVPTAYTYKSSSAFQTSMTDDFNFPVNFPLNPVAFSKTIPLSPLIHSFAYNHVPVQSSTMQYYKTSSEVPQSDSSKVYNNEMENDSVSQTLDLRVSPQTFKNERCKVNGVHSGPWVESVNDPACKAPSSMEINSIHQHISPTNIPFSAVSLFQNASTSIKSDEDSNFLPSYSGIKCNKRNESHSSNSFTSMHLSPQIALSAADQYISNSNEVCSSSSPLIGSLPQKRSNEYDSAREMTQNKVVIIQTEDAIEHFKNSLRFAETKNRGKLMNDFPSRRYSTTAPSNVSPFILNSIDTHFKHSLDAYGDTSSRKNSMDARRLKTEDTNYLQQTDLCSPCGEKNISDLELNNILNSNTLNDNSSTMDCSISPIVPMSGCKPKRCWSLRYQQKGLAEEDVNL